MRASSTYTCVYIKMYIYTDLYLFHIHACVCKDRYNHNIIIVDHVHRTLMLHSFTSIIKFVQYTFVIIMYMHNNNIMIMHEIHVRNNSIIIVVGSCLVTTVFYRLLWS